MSSLPVAKTPTAGGEAHTNNRHPKIAMSVVRCVVVWIAACCLSCASEPYRPECHKEYSYTIESCHVKRPMTKEEAKKAGLVEFCQSQGGWKRCSWITQEEMRRILRQIQEHGL